MPGKAPKPIYTESNPYLARQEAALAAIGLDNRKALENLYPYLPQLVIKAFHEEVVPRTNSPRQKVQPARRFILPYMAALGAEIRDKRSITDAAFDFAGSDKAKTIVLGARTDLRDRIARAALFTTIPGHEHEQLLTAQDTAHALAVTPGTVSEWCKPESGVLTPVRDGYWLYVPQQSIGEVAKWYIPNVERI